MKAGGATRIRYPVSPSCKRCGLGIGITKGYFRAEEKSLNPPPGEYNRKVET